MPPGANCSRTYELYEVWKYFFMSRQCLGGCGSSFGSYKPVHGVGRRGFGSNLHSILGRLCCSLILYFCVQRHGGKDTHTYKNGEDVVVWTDKVGPYNNPQDGTVQSFSLMTESCLVLLWHGPNPSFSCVRKRTNTALSACASWKVDFRENFDVGDSTPCVIEVLLSCTQAVLSIVNDL